LFHRARRFLRATGALALVSGSLFATAGVPAVAAASITIHPMLITRFASAAQVPSNADCVAQFTEPCYQPAQLQTAYDEQPLFNRGITGKGQTIVIVDSFGSPTIRSDLRAFDNAFGLPAPPSFRIIQPAGRVPRYNGNDGTQLGWAGETTLDVDWAHAMAPGARILLVETPVPETTGLAGMPQIVEAENYVINNHLGRVISQSFGAAEATFPSAASLEALRSAYINAEQQGVTVLAATGDNGATDFSNDAGTLLYTHKAVIWPSSDPLVTAVGGTQLALDSTGARTTADAAWNDGNNFGLLNAITGSPDPTGIATGGGKSAVFGRPSYQNHVARIVGSRRGVPDIAMSAACSGLVLTYNSFGGEPAGWYVACGTSEATPLFAGIVALADQVAGHSLGLINPALYTMLAHHASGLVDVTDGNNTVMFTQNKTMYTVRGYSARSGYDLVSGVGTVDAARFVPELARAAGG
jgi:subtilase family serine protease